LFQRLENYHRGLLHFLATDERVPEKVRNDMARFGLPRDEFLDHGGWPHQVYIREGRRMISDLVLTEHHTFGREIADHPIGLGSYGTDTHEIRRIVKDGVVTREGKTAGGRGGAGPYPIGYGAIVPKETECDNLFVTFALSASHTAFSSLRMEPVFMITSQSAATAASLAIDGSVPVQQVEYEVLAERLRADGQILVWSPTPRLSGIVIDDDEAVFEGDWIRSNGQTPLAGGSYRHDGNRDRGEERATFTFKLQEAGAYDVRLLYTAHENRSSRTNVVVHHVDGARKVHVDQRKPALVHGSLGAFHISAGAEVRVVVSNQGADGHVVVDGIQMIPANPK
jgi:hypothetical protein